MLAISLDARASLNIARWSVIMAIIALLFSPPLTSLAEFCLVIIIAISPELRKRVIQACQQPLVKASLVLYGTISIGTLYSVGSLEESIDMWWGWRKILLLPLAAALFNEDHWKKRLVLTVVIITALLAVISHISSALDIYIYKYTLGIVIRNHATQGIIFAVAAFSTILYLHSNFNNLNKLQRTGLTFATIILLANIAYITPGRSGYLALLVLLVVLATYLIKNRIRYTLIAPPVILVLAALSSSQLVQDKLMQVWDEATNYQKADQITAGGVRIVMWQSSLELIAERPILGYGTGGYLEASRKNTAGQSGWQGQAVDDPHNQFLRITAEHGLIGLLVFLAFLASAFKQKTTPVYQTLGRGVLLSWCATSMFSSHFSTFSEGHFIFLWCGALLAHNYPQFEQTNKP